MDAYVYQADLFCEDCIEKIKKSLNPVGIINLDDEYSYDSDEYPKGPYTDGGGEADYPHHCADCGVFLENPLTSDGQEYVKECYQEKPESEVIKEWIEFYCYLTD